MITKNKSQTAVPVPEDYVTPFKSGLSRREFIKQAGVSALLAGLIVTKPCMAKSVVENNVNSSSSEPSVDSSFSTQQTTTLAAVHLQLFPADGDGPSASDINALPYLEWALTDPDNIEDGDKEFIIKGIDWLEIFSNETHNKNFDRLSSKEQQTLLESFSKTESHENWMSLLIYYLIEALLLDPVYGGNPNGIGWKWLGHQPGFPLPDSDHTYRRYMKTENTINTRDTTKA